MQTNGMELRKGRLVAALLCCVAVVGFAGCNVIIPTDPCASNPCDDGIECSVDTCLADSNGVDFTCTYDTSACECSTDADCDDGDACNGAEICSTNGYVCEDGEPVDCGDQICDPADGSCVDCLEASDCDDDNLFCTGAPVCDDGVCGFEDTCAAGEVCIEDADTCGECMEDADCDAGEVCNTTTYVCEAATCTTDDDCGDMQICADSGLCEDIECETDADCDDGLYCNGAETCDTTGFTCVAGTDPCADDETCDEDTDSCETAGSETVVLTSGTDIETTSSGNDLFIGDLVNEGGVANVQTLNGNDQLNGGSGTDTLIATIKADVTPASLAGIEIIQVSNIDNGGAGEADPVLTNAPDVTTCKTSGNAEAIAFTGIQTVASEFHITNNTQNVTFQVASTKLTGGTDSATLYLSSVTAGTVTIEPSAAGSGYETLTINSGGGVANALTSLVDGNGNSLATINVTGSQDLDLDAANLDATVLTFDASAATGDVDVALGAAGNAATVFGGSGDDKLTCTAAQNFTIDAGAGNDEIDVSGAYTTSDTIAGGDGTTDKLVLAVTEADPASAQSNVTGIEILSIDTDASNDEVDASMFGVNIVEFTADSAGGGGAPVVSGLTTGATIMTGTAVDAFGSTTAVDVNLSDAAGGGDALTLDVNNTTGGGNLDWDVSGVEVLTIDTVGSNQTNTMDLTDAQLGTLTCLIGSGNLDLDGTALGTVVTTVDASGSSSTGGLLVLLDGASAINGATITGTANADTIAASSQDDTIDGGAGVDTITGDDGADSITTGTGADKIYYTALTDGGVADAGTTVGADVLTDFTVGTGGDIMSFSGTVFAPTGANAATIDYQEVTSATNGTAAVGLVDPNTNTELSVVVNTTTLANWAAVETFCDTTINAAYTNAANDEVIVIVEVTGIGQIVVHDPDLGTANDLLVLATFNPTITLADLVAANFDEHVN